eukprot:1466778-Amphidinium_carterae.1
MSPPPLCSVLSKRTAMRKGSSLQTLLVTKWVSCTHKTSASCLAARVSKSSLEVLRAETFHDSTT